MTKNQLVEKLSKLDTCSDATNWVKAQNCDSAQEIWDNCNKQDWLMWYLRRTQIDKTEQFTALTIECAKLVLPIFESKYPSDNRPRMAIEVAKGSNAAAADAAAVAAAADAAAADAAVAAAADAAAVVAVAASIKINFHKLAKQAMKY